MVEDELHAGREAGLNPKKLRLLRGGDLRESALLALFRMVVATMPVSKWAAIADSVALLGKGRGSSRYKRFAGRVRAVSAGVADHEVFRLWRAYGAAVNRRRMSVLASRCCPDWKPRIELTGRQHVDQGISAGRGSILWLDNFIHHSLIGKRAFADAGYKAWQMSSADHGFSSSLLGRRFLNPIQLAAEMPLGLGRIEFDAGSALTATREVTRCLARNELVASPTTPTLAASAALCPSAHPQGSQWRRHRSTSQDGRELPFCRFSLLNASRSPNTLLPSPRLFWSPRRDLTPSNSPLSPMRAILSRS